MTLQYDIKSKTINLEEITSNIRKLSDHVGLNYVDLVARTYKESPRQYEIPVESGKALTRGLYKGKEAAISLTAISANTRLDYHIHEEVEIVKVLKGMMHVTVDGEEGRTYSENEIIMMKAYTAHSVYWPVESTILSITIPACPSWPERAYATH